MSITNDYKLWENVYNRCYILEAYAILQICEAFFDITDKIKGCGKITILLQMINVFLIIYYFMGLPLKLINMSDFHNYFVIHTNKGY